MLTFDLTKILGKGAFGNRPANSFFLDKHCDLVDGLGCEIADGPQDDLRNDFQLILLVNGLDYSVIKLLASFIAKFESIRQDATTQRKKNPEKIENKEYACFP
jgi:hypothetical protein